MNWTNFEDAIQARVVAATGLPGAKVIWENQNKARPLRPFIALRIDDAESLGEAETKVTNNPAPSSGQEILLTTRSQNRVQLTVTCFTTSTSGDSSARAYLKKLQMYLSHPSCTATLNGLAEPIGILTASSVQDASIVLETDIEGRAVMTVVCLVADAFTEATTYIETVVESGTISPPD